MKSIYARVAAQHGESRVRPTYTPAEKAIDLSRAAAIWKMANSELTSRNRSNELRQTANALALKHGLTYLDFAADEVEALQVMTPVLKAVPVAEPAIDWKARALAAEAKLAAIREAL
jgi:hypothetical protein